MSRRVVFTVGGCDRRVNGPGMMRCWYARRRSFAESGESYGVRRVWPDVLAWGLRQRAGAESGEHVWNAEPWETGREANGVKSHHPLHDLTGGIQVPGCPAGCAVYRHVKGMWPR